MAVALRDVERLEAERLLIGACAWLRLRIPHLVEATHRAIARELPEYRQLPAPVLARVRADSAALYAQVITALENGRLPASDRLETLGMHRAEQLISLDAVLRSLQIGHELGWRALAERLEREASSPALGIAFALAGSRLIAAIHELTRRVEVGHRAGRERVESPAARRRRDLLRDVLTGALGDDVEVRRRAMAVGIDLRVRHAVVVLVAPRTPRDPTELRAAATAMGRALTAVHEVSFLDTDCPHVVFAVPVDAGDDGAWRCAMATMRSVLQRHGGVTAVVALAPSPWCPSAFHAAYARARDVGPLAAAMHPGAVISDADTDVLSVITSDAARIRAFVVRVCARLLTEPGARRDELVATVRAYLACGQSIRATAQRRRLSERTVSNHVARLAELTGRDVAADHLPLSLALALLPALDSAAG